MRNQTSAVPDRVASWRWSIILVLVSLAALAPVLRAGFVRWDDDENFTHNPDFGGLTLAGLRWAWTSYQVGVYQPLAWILLEAQDSLWGLHPTGYHAVSLVMHAANAVVLYGLCKALLRRALPGEWVNDRRPLNLASAFAAALFAIHPLRVEVVAWASCQPYLPSVFFAMLSVLAYLHAHPEAGPVRPRWIIAAWLLVVAAMLCKAVAVTVPVLLVILDVYPLCRIGPGHWLDRRVWREKIGFLAPAVVFMVIALRAKGYYEIVMLVSRYGLNARVAQSFYGLGFYLLKTIWPVGLAAYYPLPERVDLLEWPFSIAALSVVAISAGAILLRSRWPGFLAVWSAYMVILLPNLGLVRIGSQIAADRYAYMASIPLAVAVAWAVFQLLRAVHAHPFLRGAAGVGAMALLFALGARSWEQCRTWQTSKALWLNASNLCGGRSLAILGSLGQALVEAGQVEEGVALFRQVLRWDPDAPMAHYNLGVYLVWRDRFEEAESHFRVAVRGMPRLSPYLADAHYNLGLVLEKTDRLDEAIAEYMKALRLNPRDAATHNNLGAVRLRQGRYAEAETHFNEALRLDPQYALARRGRDFARQMQTTGHRLAKPNGA